MVKDIPAVNTGKSKNPEDKITQVDFRFGQDSTVRPTGMEGITMDEEVTVTLQGHIKSFSNGEPYDKSKRFSLQIGSCEIVKSPENKETSMDDAMIAADTTRKKME